MPSYEFKSNKTGEIKEVFMSISAYSQWMLENPEWERHYSGAPALVSQSKSTMRQAGSEWQNHLSRIKKGSGKDNTIKT